MLNIPSEFSGSVTKDIILNKGIGRYEGVFNPEFNKPTDETRASDAWKECCDIAALGLSNPKGSVEYHWFNKTTTYKNRCQNGNLWSYKFAGTTNFY